MVSAMTEKELVEKKLVEKHELEYFKDSLKGNLHRARSVVIGTAFGGTIEIGLRCNNGDYKWALLRDFEALEVLHQLGAAIGCEIEVKHRTGKGAYRNFKV